MDPYVGCHAFHFFGGLLLFLLGIGFGRAISWRRMMRFGPPPWAYGAGWYGGHCGPHPSYWYGPHPGAWGPAPGAPGTPPAATPPAPPSAPAAPPAPPSSDKAG
jgi:hypothetical protein